MGYHYARWPAPVVRARMGPIYELVDRGEPIDADDPVDPMPPWNQRVVGYDDGGGVVAAMCVELHGDHPADETRAALATKSPHVVETLVAGRARSATRNRDVDVRVERFVPGARLNRFLRKLAALDGQAPASFAALVGRSLVGAAVDVQAAAGAAGTAAKSQGHPPQLLLLLDDVHVGWDGAVRALPRFDGFMSVAGRASGAAGAGGRNEGRALPEVLRAQLTPEQRLGVVDTRADVRRIGAAMAAVLRLCAPPPALLLKAVDDALQPVSSARPTLANLAAALDGVLGADPFGPHELGGLVSSTLPGERARQLAFVESIATIDRDFVQVEVQPFTPV